MRTAKTLHADQLRPEYRRSDFGALVRGKYVERLRKSSNVVVIDPAIADVFPNAAAVNAALRSLAEIAKRASAAQPILLDAPARPRVLPKKRPNAKNKAP